jgi:hypothetical protein
MADDARIGYLPTRVWGDSGRAIPEGDEARELIRQLEARAAGKS